MQKCRAKYPNLEVLCDI